MTGRRFGTEELALLAEKQIGYQDSELSVQRNETGLQGRRYRVSFHLWRH